MSYVEDSDVLTRFQLKTTFHTSEGKFIEPVQEFEVGSADIAKMIRTMRDHRWVQFFDDLIHAKSDRAYLYRYNKLAEWDEEWALADEEKWGVEWDTNPLRGARQLFADRLVSVTRRPDGILDYEKLGDLDDFRDEGFNVKLPCGHP